MNKDKTAMCIYIYILVEKIGDENNVQIVIYNEATYKIASKKVNSKIHKFYYNSEK